MSNEVLLARPHPAIVNDMKHFLELAGFAPKPAKSLDDIKSSNIANISGSIISMASSSDIFGSAQDVFLYLRQNDPNIPIAISSIVGYQAASKAFLADLGGAEGMLKVLPISKEVIDYDDLGNLNTIIFIQRRDIIAANLAPITQKILKKHFR